MLVMADIYKNIRDVVRKTFIDRINISLLINMKIRKQFEESY